MSGFALLLFLLFLVSMISIWLKLKKEEDMNRR